MRLSLHVPSLLLALLLAAPVTAQPAGSPGDEAEALYREALAYAEAAEPDYGAAKRTLRRALRLRPDHVPYLTLRLRLLREAPRNFLPTVQEIRRRELAERILALDSTVALAHAELGDWEAATYFQFRDAADVRGDQDPQDGALGDPYAAFRSYDEIAARRRAVGATVLDKSDTAAPARAAALDRFERAFAADPSEPAAYEPLLRLYLADSSFADARRVAERVLQHRSEASEAYRYAGLTRFFDDDLEAAQAAFDRALALLPPDERRAWDDLSLLFDEQPDARAAFAQPEDDSTGGQDAARRFWTVEDPRLLTPVSERRLEHFARLAYADLFYGTDTQRGWSTDIGRVLVRYGFPERRERVRTDGQSMAGAQRIVERWYYPDFYFSFDKEFRADAFQFVDYIQSGAQAVFHDRSQQTQYAPPGTAMSFPFAAYAFKDGDDATALYVPAAIPVPRRPRAGALRYPLQTGAFLLTPTAGLVAQTVADATALPPLALRSVGEQTYWLTTPTLTAAPGAYTLAVEFEADDASAGGHERREVTLPDFGGGLQLSSLVLAERVEERLADTALAPGEIARPGYAVQPLPWDTLAIGQPIRLYVEAYGLTPGRAYTVETTVTPEGPARGLFRRLFGGGRPDGVSAAFPLTAAQPDEGQAVTLDASTLAPGAYTIRLRLLDPETGASAEQTRTVALRAP